MLQHLSLRDFILVDQAEIAFPSGFVAITGETGAGKTAILQAIQLLFGGKTDHRFIRKGAEKATIEGVFAFPPSAQALFSEAGFDVPDSEELFLRREITQQGKSRSWVNHQLASQALLKQLAPHLGLIVSQSTHTELLSSSLQRELLDTLGNLDSFCSEMTESWNELKRTEETIAYLKDQGSSREQRLQQCQKEKEEIVSLNPQEGEDDDLFAEYHLLSHAEERSENLYALYKGLAEDKGLVPHMRQLQRFWDPLVDVDPSLEPMKKQFDNLFIELDDLSTSLSLQRGKVEANPHRLQEVNDRLAAYHRLKRLYGGTVEGIYAHLVAIEEEITLWETWEERLSEAEERKAAAQKRCDQAAETLSKRRQAFAESLAPKVEEGIRHLNMPNARFTISITHQERTALGQDRVEFLLAPNLGGEALPLRSGASGGEVARVWFALQHLLGKEKEVPLLLFDEVDANIGGQTARRVAQIAKNLSKECQIIWITHFPQVAEEADTQIQISKEERHGTTRTRIQTLGDKTRQEELSRMAGL